MYRNSNDSPLFFCRKVIIERPRLFVVKHEPPKLNRHTNIQLQKFEQVAVQFRLPITPGKQQLLHDPRSWLRDRLNWIRSRGYIRVVSRGGDDRLDFDISSHFNWSSFSSAGDFVLAHDVDDDDDGEVRIRMAN